MDDVDTLRAEAARHTGPARVTPLLRLSERLEADYWRAGPGRPASGPVLDELVDVLDAACALIAPGSVLRGRAAGQLGNALATRHTVHFGSEDDRDRAVPLLEESLTSPALPHILQVRNRQQLATLLATRAMRGLQDPQAMMRLMTSGPPPAGAADADRAVTLLREVRDGPVVGSHITEVTELMLEMAETVQTLLGGARRGPAGLDLGRMVEAAGRMAELQRRMAAQPRGAGFGYVPNAFDFAADDLAARPPHERPVMVVDAPGSAAAAGTDPSRPPSRTPAATYRDAAAAVLGTPTALLDLLVDDAVAPDVDTVDEAVALTMCLVDAPDAVAADHLPCAVARYLRGTADGGGDVGADDLAAAATHLLACAAALAGQPGDAVAVALRLADLLAERVGGAAVHDRLAAAFAPAHAALRAAGPDALAVPGPGRWWTLDAPVGRFVAGPAAGLPPRVVVLGDGAVPPGIIAAHVRTADQLVALAARGRRPITAAPVFVADPRGDRPAAGGDALVLRRTFFPRSTGLGRMPEASGGAGTPDEVRARTDASLLHLGCAVTPDGGLALAGGEVLPAAVIAAETPGDDGGLAVLPPPADAAAAPGTARLTDALLAARCTDVIGFREPVPDPVASLVYVLLYTHLVDERRDPADAVAAVRRWLADPHRTPPEGLPPWYATPPADADLTGLAIRDVLVHHGR